MILEQFEILEKQLIEKGYTKYNGHYKSEDYGYWKSFDVIYNPDKEIGYQIVFLVYDWIKYKDRMHLDEFPNNRIGVQIEMLAQRPFERIDISIMNDEEEMNIEWWENKYKEIYEFLCKTNQK